MTESMPGPGEDPIQVTPVVVLLQVFPARPSSIPDIRDFVRRCLAESPLTEEGTREVGETVFRALLDAAGPTGSIQVAFRIFPEHVEVDVLHSDNQIQPLRAAPNAYPQRPGHRSHGRIHRDHRARRGSRRPGPGPRRTLLSRAPPRGRRTSCAGVVPRACRATRTRSRTGCPRRCAGKA